MIKHVEILSPGYVKGLSKDIKDALNASLNPSASNAFITVDDLMGFGVSFGHAANYSALPSPSTVSGKFYWVDADQGTAWLPGSLGGTYYPKGLYYSNGTTWSTVDSPINASQAQVDGGTINNMFVTPKTLTDWQGIDDIRTSLNSKIGTSTTNTLTNKTLDSYTNFIHADGIHLRVKATQSLAYGDVLKFVGFNAGEQAIEVAKRDSTSVPAIGVLHDTLATGEFGMAVSNGLFKNVNTIAFSEGTILYPNTSGGFTTTNPGGYAQQIAYVVRSHAVNGEIMLSVGPVYGLDRRGLTGNAGTTAGTNFIGTTDDIDHVFKRNSVEFFRNRKATNRSNRTELFLPSGIDLSFSRSDGYFLGVNTNSTTGYGDNTLSLFGVNQMNFSVHNGDFTWYNSSSFITPRMTLKNTTGNLLIGTTTDAGYKLDVNGTGRFSDNLQLEKSTSSGIGINVYNPLYTNRSFRFYLNGASAAVPSWNNATIIESYAANGGLIFSSVGGVGSSNAPFIWQMGGSRGEVMRVATSGNLILGSSTDAGYKADIVGSLRVGSAGLWLSRTDSPATVTSIRYSSEDTIDFFKTLRTSTGILANSNFSTASLSLNLGYGYSVIKTPGAGTGSVELELKTSAAAAQPIYRITNDTTTFFQASQNNSIEIGTTTSDASSVLTVASTTKGFLPPRMTSAQRTAITSPTTGLIVYQTDDTEGLYEKTASAWRIINGGGGSSSKEIRITIPGQLVGDANNYQGLYWKNNTGATVTVSNVAIFLANAAAGGGAACTANVYKSSGTAADGINTNAVALFASAISLGTNNDSPTNAPTTTTVENGRYVSLRVATVGGTPLPGNLQCIITYS